MLAIRPVQLRLMMLAWLAVVVAVVGGTSAGPAENSATAASADRWAQDLGSLDRTVSEAAERRLTELGWPARAAVYRAWRSADPQLSAVAASLLHRLPWTNPDDPAPVQELLNNFASLETGERQERISRLQALGAAAVDALLRIAREEPQAEVRWSATLAVQNLASASNIKQRLQSVTLHDDDPATLFVIVGWILRDTDRQRGDALLEKALAMESAAPTAVHGELTRVFNWRADEAAVRGDWPTVLATLRQQAQVTEWSDESVPQPVLRIISLHALHGPLPDLLQDLQLNGSYLLRPATLHCLAVLQRRHGYWLSGAALSTTAYVVSGFDPDKHFEVGQALHAAGLDDPARFELRTALALTWLDERQTIVRMNAYMQLAQVYQETGDDLATAKAWEMVLKLLPSSGAILTRENRYGESSSVIPAEELQVDIDTHYLKAAQARNNLPAINHYMDKLLAAKKPDMAADIVPLLRAGGRNAEADKLFEEARRLVLETIAADPANAAAKNNLAWLCAESNRNLDEALQASQQAVAADPMNSAFIDTLAEIHFLRGDIDKAVDLERTAIALRPNFDFLKKQLDRFQKAASTRPGATQPDATKSPRGNSKDENRRAK